MDGASQRQGIGAGGRSWRVGMLAPLIVLGGALVALTVHCHGMLHAAVAGERPQVGVATWAIVGGFVFACAAAVAWQCVRLANAVAGPELRLCRALQRARAGGLTPPIRLRRGDLLQGLAAECNELLASMPSRLAAAAPDAEARREGAQP